MIQYIDHSSLGNGRLVFGFKANCLFIFTGATTSKALKKGVIDKNVSKIKPNISIIILNYKKYT